MFIRKKRSGNYIVESRRINGKVRQKTIAYLGHESTIEDRLHSLTYRMEFTPRPWDDDKTRWPHRWRRTRQWVARKLYLTDDDFLQNHPECQGGNHNHKMKIFEACREMLIDGYLEAKHEVEVKRAAKKRAYCEAELAKLWSLIPVDQHAALAATIKERQEARKRHMECAAERIRQRLMLRVPHVAADTASSVGLPLG